MYQYKCKCGSVTALYSAPVPEYENAGFVCGTCAGNIEDSNYSREGQEPKVNNG